MVQYVVVVRPVNHVKWAIGWILTGGLNTPWWIARTVKWNRAKRATK